MHRSGTSLVASSLAGAGVDMGRRLLAGDEHNPPGYFEDTDFLELDRRILAAASPAGEAGHPDWGWTESERLDEAAFEAHREEARELVAARTAAGHPWGFKDPRAALLLDFWLAQAPDARFVLPYRLPWEVADSMQRLGAEVFLARPDYGYRIWAFYNRRLLDFHRRHPERSALVSIDAAVDEPGRFAQALRAALGLELPADALAARSAPELLHRVPPGDPLVALAGAAHPECRELLAALDREAALPASCLWHSDPPRRRATPGDPRVAVVVPCFEDGENLIEAVASVDRAIEVPHELVVVDDGSRDARTRAVLALLESAGYAVHRRPHRGVAAARNHGFAAARAPFVIPLDSDNRLVPGFVEQALGALAEEPGLAAVYGDRAEFGGRRGRVEVGRFEAERLVAGNYVDACAVIRRQAWSDCGGYDEAMPRQGWEDWDLWLALIARGWTLRWLPVPGFEYRVRPNSMLQVLEKGPDLPGVLAYVLGKHPALFVGSLRRSLTALYGARADIENARRRLAEAESALAGRAAALAEARRAVEELEIDRRCLDEELRNHTEELRNRTEERDALDRQRHALHDSLAAWRAHTTEMESGRALRLRRRLLRLRSRFERRARTGPAHPCVIGATGGSGTRAFAVLATRGGLAIGDDRNEAEDALPIERFLDRWVVPFWEGGGAEPPHPAPPGMDGDLQAALMEQFATAGKHSGPLGWKSLRSLYVLPFLAQRFPDLRFLHVVRDGRDMALSANQLQLGRYETILLTASEQAGSEPERSAALWSRINLWAAEVGERLGGAYLRVRWEDLCARPVAVTRRVFRFLDLPGDPRRAARLVVPPETLGRWRHADPALVARLESIAGPALERFGYLPTGGEPDGRRDPRQPGRATPAPRRPAPG